MVRLTITQSIKVIKTYYENGDSGTATTYRALRGDYGLHNRPTTQGIGKIVKKFEETGGSGYKYYKACESSFHSFCFNESVAEDPNVSIARRSQELGLSYGTLWHILQLDPHLLPYQVQLTQQLKPADHSQGRRYVEWVLEQQELDGDFSM